MGCSALGLGGDGGGSDGSGSDSPNESMDDPSESTVTRGGVGCSGTLGIRVGNCAPEFKLPTADGREITLSKVLGGLLVIHVQSPWSQASYESSFAMETVYRDFPTVGFLEVMMENEAAEAPTLADAQNWQTSLRLTYTLLYDAEGTFQAAWGFEDFVPFAVILDETGIVAATIGGNRDGVYPNDANISSTLRGLMR